MDGQWHKRYLQMVQSGLKIHPNLKMIFLQNYNEHSDERYFFEIDVQCPEKLHDLHNDLLLLPERIKIEKSKHL